MAEKKLLYALVARGNVVLAEHSTIGGNANLVAMRILDKLPQEDTRVSYAQERHMFHVAVQDGITYLCMAEEALGRRIPFSFLEDVRKSFTSKYPSLGSAAAYALNAEFAPVLAQRMEFFSNDRQADVLNRVRGEIAEVRSIMIENIEKVLERGERLDLLVDKTEHLQGEAFAFNRQAARLKREMWWQNARMWMVIGGIVTFVIYFIVAMACGFTFSKC